MTTNQTETSLSGAGKQSPPEPLAALRTLLAAMEHHGIPESWPDDLYEELQLAALHQEEDATEEDGEDAAIVAAAREMYGSTEIEFDSKPEVSIGDDGAFVSAWVFVPNSSLPMRDDGSAALK